MPTPNKLPKNKAHKLYTDLESFAILSEQHSLKSSDFDRNAVKTVQQLEQAGFQALIVGGAVRDLLCGLRPKDFDIATNARPEEVRALFKRSRIIGRRFKIVHLYFGRDVLEVATFRADAQSTSLETSPQGQILRDNNFGGIREDALRRDFSANSLYYSPSSECIYDFTDGFRDIQEHRIRLLGNPEERFKEDPVRMLRAYRFASKLDFKLDQTCQQQIKLHKTLLLNVSNARMFDESIKLFHSIHAGTTVNALRENHLFEILFPMFEQHTHDKPWVEKMLNQALQNTQDRILLNKPVTIAYLYAVLLWPELTKRYSIGKSGKHDFAKLATKALSLIREQSHITAIPKRHAYAIKDIWEYQIRLQERRPKKIMWIMHQRRFRAAFDFLELREACGESDMQVAPWWEEIQFADDQRQKAMIQKLQGNRPKNRNKGRQN